MTNPAAHAPLDFRANDEQHLLLQSLTRLARDELAPAAAACDEARRTPAALCQQIHALGLLGLGVPSAQGGFGGERDLLTQVLALEALAQGDASLTTAALAPMSVVSTVLTQGSEAQRHAWLPLLLQEQFVASGVAVHERLGHLAGLSMRADKVADGYVLTGDKRCVPHGANAAHVLVIATETGAGAPVAFLLGAEHRQQVESAADPCMGFNALPTASLRFADCRVPATTRLGDGTTPFDLQNYLDRGRLGIAALAVGTCAAVLDYCRDYVNTREAFGEPISHRQAVAFMIADMATELEAMRLLLWQATSLGDSQTIARMHGHIADYSMQIGTHGVQLLGGPGYIREHPVERWYRQLRGMAMLTGLIAV